VARRKKKFDELILRFDGLDKEVIIGAAAEIKISDTSKEFVHFEKMKDDRWKMFFTSTTMSDEEFERFRGFTIERIDDEV